MSTDLLPVPFHGKTLYVVDQDGEPFTPMKPIVEGMGLNWDSQLDKVRANKARWGVAIIAIPSRGGKQETLCIPLRKLPGWLATIHPSKVRPEIRERIETYQRECDDALWAYWTQGHAINHRSALPALPYRMRLMVVFENGQLTSTTPIPDDAYVFRHEDIPKILESRGEVVISIAMLERYALGAALQSEHLKAILDDVHAIERRIGRELYRRSQV